MNSSKQTSPQGGADEAIPGKSSGATGMLGHAYNALKEAFYGDHARQRLLAQSRTQSARCAHHPVTYPKTKP